MDIEAIKTNCEKIKAEIPDNVKIVIAAKTRSVDELKAALAAGMSIVGENYVQEAEEIKESLGRKSNSLKWHMIGHLQTNKVKLAVEIFDMIETLDSLKLAAEIDKRAKEVNKIMPVLVEVNSGEEDQKTGLRPEKVIEFIRDISLLQNIKLSGLMTMGPRFGDPENARDFFKKTKSLFDEISALKISNVQMKYLSMGMSNTYKIAIEEGSNMIRPGSIIFGQREQS
ncbi:MAG: YggS family pyridoxal phosphate-dependent enzyme [Candidatus Kappaea frigidicola]|nr:YggS family pyridoxal phosphate-dependent enzyme [Candidatus Kappaea frigidicola]